MRGWGRDFGGDLGSTNESHLDIVRRSIYIPIKGAPSIVNNYNYNLTLTLASNACETNNLLIFGN